MRFTAVIFIWFFTLTLCHAQSVSEDRAIASYLYNFATHIDWPSSEGGSFGIHVISSDSQLEKEVRKTLASQKLNGKPINVTRGSDANIPSATQMVFIDKEASNLYQQAFHKVEGRPILLVSHGYANKKLVMINLTDVNGKLRFEINKANILNQGLAIDPKIILLGGTELDVAQLYKSTKDSLISKEEELGATQKKAASLAQEIKNKELLLEATRKKTEQYKSEADALKKSLELQKVELTKERDKLLGVQASLDEMKKKFEQAEIDFKKRKEEIAQKELTLTNLTAQVKKEQGKLEGLEKSVAEQKELLEARDETISHQQTYIVIASAFAMLFLLFVAAIALLLRREHRSKVKLMEAQAMLIGQGKMAQMGEMLTMIAHHWRQPLNRVGVIAQNIEDDYLYGDLKAGVLQKSVADIMVILNDISSTINRFSAAAKNEAKGYFDPCEEVENIINLFEPEFASYRVLMEYKKVTGLSVFGDQNQFGEAISSILKNAEEALASKGSDEERKITAEFKHSGENIVLEIFDNGDAIPEEFLTRIFEPFFTTKGITQKTGLGLYSAKSVIEAQFGGTIEAINMQNGVKFVITIPIKRDIK
jgi:signal transduction histidine kinase